MPIIATDSGNGTFTPAPEGGHQAVCVDVIDLGFIETTFEGKKKSQHKVSIVWQINELREDNTRFLAFKRYTLSLNEKAALRHDLESWRGKAFTADELRGFDIERLLGANALVNITHVTRNGKTYANVVSVMPLLRGMVKMAPDGYTRKQEQQPDAHHDASDAVEPAEEEDVIPF